MVLDPTMIGAGIGGAMGIGQGIAGALDTSQADAINAYKKSVRAGVRKGQMTAAGAYAQYLNTPEMVAYQNQLRSLYGLPALGGGPVGMDNPLEVGGEYYLAAPSPYQKMWKQSGSNVKQGLNRLAKDIRASGTGDDAHLAGLYDRLSKLDDRQANLLAERLQAKYGVSADTFKDVYGRARAAAGVAAPEAPTSGAPGYMTLTDEYRKQLEVTLGGQGFAEGVGPQSAEAAGLAVYNQNLRMGMLPQLAGVAPNQLAAYQGLLQQMLPMGVYSQSGGMAVYGQMSPFAGAVEQGPAALASNAMNQFATGAMTGAQVGAALGGGGMPNMTGWLSGRKA